MIYFKKTPDSIQVAEDILVILLNEQTHKKGINKCQCHLLHDWLSGSVSDRPAWVLEHPARCDVQGASKQTSGKHVRIPGFACPVSSANIATVPRFTVTGRAGTAACPSRLWSRETSRMANIDVLALNASCLRNMLPTRTEIGFILYSYETVLYKLVELKFALRKISDFVQVWQKCWSR